MGKREERETGVSVNDRIRVGAGGVGMDRGGVHQVRAAMLPCSTSPAVVPAAAATAAAAAVTEAGAVVCLLPTVKESDAQTHKEKESYGGRGG